MCIGKQIYVENNNMTGFLKIISVYIRSRPNIIPICHNNNIIFEYI